jgi:hypothetical protein
VCKLKLIAINHLGCAISFYLHTFPLTDGHAADAELLFNLRLRELSFFEQPLNRNRQHWYTHQYSTGSVSDLSFPEMAISGRLRSLTLPVLYQCCLFRFSF